MEAKDLGIMAGIWLVYGVLARTQWFLTDDGYISFRYARNLVNGLGLRFNPTESPPVEGYSNLLWVLWCAVGEALGVDVGAWAAASSFLCGVGVLWLVYRALWVACGVPRWVAAAATALLGLFPPFFVWSTGGLETMPFVLCAFATFDGLVLRGDRRAATWMAVIGAVLLVLVRVEGLAWAILLCAGGAVVRKLQRRPVRPAVVTLAVVACVFLSHLLWRHSYHGAWVSNTAVAKVGMSLALLLRGAEYIATYLTVFVVPMLLVPAAWLVWRGSRRVLGMAALGYVAVSFGYAMAVGGDFMAMGRLFAPGWPFMAMVLGLALAELKGRVAMVVAAVTLVIAPLPAANIHLVPIAVRWKFNVRRGFGRFWSEAVYADFMNTNVDRARKLGLALRELLPHEAAVVTGGIGCIGYFSDLTIHDRMGLVDREVARRPTERLVVPGHDKAVEPGFFLPRKPEIMVPMFAEDDAEREAFEKALRKRASQLPEGHPYTVRVQPFGDGYVLALARAGVELGEPK